MFHFPRGRVNLSDRNASFCGAFVRRGGPGYERVEGEPDMKRDLFLCRQTLLSLETGAQSNLQDYGPDVTTIYRGISLPSICSLADVLVVVRLQNEKHHRVAPLVYVSRRSAFHFNFEFNVGNSRPDCCP